MITPCQENLMSRKKFISKRESRNRQKKKNLRLFGGFLAIGLLVIIAFMLLSPDRVSDPIGQSTDQDGLSLEITVEMAYQKYQEGAYLLDIREKNEWIIFHIPETVNIPLDELPYRLAEIPLDREIIVICNTGNRSKQGRDFLLQAEFSWVKSMQGGVTGWSDAGFPIEGKRP